MNELELTIQIYIRQPNFGGGSISMEHRMTINCGGFMEMCRILAEFDELAKRVKAEQDSQSKKK